MAYASKLNYPEWFNDPKYKLNPGKDSYRNYFTKDQWRRYNAARMMGRKSKIIKEDDDIEI